MWNFRKFGSNTAFLDECGNQLTYMGLQEETELLSTIVGGRCLVFSLCTNTIGSVVGYTAFLENRIVPVLLSAHMDSELLSRLMETYHPDYLWVPQDSADGFRAVESVYEKYGLIISLCEMTNRFKAA